MVLVGSHSPLQGPVQATWKMKTQEGIHYGDLPSLIPDVPRQFTFFLAFRVLCGCLLVYVQGISLYLEGRSWGN